MTRTILTTLPLFQEDRVDPLAAVASVEDVEEVGKAAITIVEQGQ